MKNGNVINIDKEINKEINKEVNWDLYKGENTNRGKQGYIGFWNEIIKARYQLLGEYKGTKTKVNVKCDKGHEYEVTADSFRQGNRCSKCQKEKIKKTSELDFIRQLKEAGYKLLSPYINNSTKVLVSCDKNHEYLVKPNDFKSGHRCRICAGQDSKTAELGFIRLVKEAGYELLGEYVNAKTKVKVRCDKGHIYSVAPRNLKNRRRCPICKIKSKGEMITEKLLKKADIEFEPQMEFDKMVDKRNLSYDFYLFDSKIAIEIQGIQHYKAIDFYGGEEKFKVQKRHDEIKRNYAKANGIRLIEIPYYGRKYNIKYVEKEVKRIIEEVRIFITETESKQLKFIF